MSILVPRSAQAQGDFQRHLTAAIRLYENLEYERALTQINLAKQLPHGAEAELELSLYEGIIQAELGQQDPARGEAAAQALRKEGGEVLFVATDVSRGQDVLRLVETVLERWGRLDLAVNNASLAEMRLALTAELSEEEFDRAAKHGVHGLSRTAAMEYGGQGVRVNVLCPGAYRTPMLEGVGKSLKRRPCRARNDRTGLQAIPVRSWCGRQGAFTDLPDGCPRQPGAAVPAKRSTARSKRKLL